jgi:hypothetical protein
LSSILRALKKLDEEALSRERKPGDREITVHQVVKRKSGVSRYMNPFTFIPLLISIVLLGIAGWIYFNPEKKPVDEKKQDSQSYVQRNIANDSRVISKPSPSIVPLPGNNPSHSPVSTRNPQPFPLPLPLPPAQINITEHASESKEPVEAKEKPKHPPFTSTLDGILWSDNPERRVAIINGKYFKEGEVIDGVGVTVVSIEKNAVVLKSGQETWTIKMNKPNFPTP